MFKVGRYLRKRYANLLGNGEYSRDKVYVFASDSDRVLMSAEACLAGLLSPKKHQIWNKNINWQPIPVHTIPKHDDNVFDLKKKCDRYEAIQQKVEEMLYGELYSKYAPLIDYLEKNTGGKLNSLYALEKLYDTLYEEKIDNYRLPPWTDSLQNNSEYKVIFFSRFPSYTFTTEMKKIKSGFLLKAILDRFTNKTKTTLSPDRSLWMYFGHETNIANMLNSLGLYKTLHQPPYASCIFFELHKSDGNFNVQIYYKNSTNNPMNIPPMYIPGCGRKCPLHKMYELYDQILPKQSFEEECILP